MHIVNKVIEAIYPNSCKKELRQSRNQLLNKIEELRCNTNILASEIETYRKKRELVKVVSAEIVRQ